MLREQSTVWGTKYARLYSYYPSSQVYYSAMRDTYWWQEGAGDWKDGTVLPAYIEISDETPVTIELFSAKPQKSHDEVSRWYMPGYQHGSTAAFANVPTDF